MTAGKLIKCLSSVSFLLLPLKVLKVQSSLLVSELYLVPPPLFYQKVWFPFLVTLSSRSFMVFLPWNESTALFRNSILSLNVSLVCREGKRF